MTTALIKSSRYLTLGDLLTLELPHLSTEEAMDVLWEFTGYPVFFTGDDHPLNQLQRELKDFREGKINPWPE